MQLSRWRLRTFQTWRPLVDIVHKQTLSPLWLQQNLQWPRYSFCWISGFKMQCCLCNLCAEVKYLKQKQSYHEMISQQHKIHSMIFLYLWQQHFSFCFLQIHRPTYHTLGWLVNIESHNVNNTFFSEATWHHWCTGWRLSKLLIGPDIYMICCGPEL